MNVMDLFQGVSVFFCLGRIRFRVTVNFTYLLAILVRWSSAVHVGPWWGCSAARTPILVLYSPVSMGAAVLAIWRVTYPWNWILYTVGYKFLNIFWLSETGESYFKKRNMYIIWKSIKCKKIPAELGVRVNGSWLKRLGKPLWQECKICHMCEVGGGWQYRITSRA